MDNREARSVLSLHRAGEEASDSRFAEALRQVAADPELARWWREEQELDRAIAAKLSETPVPADLKARLISQANSPPRVSFGQRTWRRTALLAAAAVVALAVLFGSWRGPFQPVPSLADYRDEMISFVKLTPPLELETSDLTRIANFFGKSGAPSQIDIPSALRELEPTGCRILRFGGQDVALVCFKRSDGRLAHLLVLNRSALRGLPASQPEYAAQGEWMTASWIQDEDVYLLAAQGDRATVEQFMSDK